jgi:hypothetical protein
MKFLLILLLIFFVFPPLLRYFFRLFIKDQFQKAQKQFYNDQVRPPGPTGRTDVDFVPPQKSKKQDFKGGEYVDYEEVKD